MISAISIKISLHTKLISVNFKMITVIYVDCQVISMISVNFKGISLNSKVIYVNCQVISVISVNCKVI